MVYLGREYPAGYTDFFRPKLKAAFLKKKDLTDEQEILKSIQFGEYIIKGLFFDIRCFSAFWLHYPNPSPLD